MKGLHNKYAGFEIPDEIKQMEKIAKTPVIGSKGMTKMVLFADQEKIDNSIIDHYMKIPPQRQEGETQEEYKNRTRFQKALVKYRSYIYDYSVY